MRALSGPILILAVLGAAPALAQKPSGNGHFGVWRNPQNSVHVEARRCGASMCGVVVWANAKAKADARDGGTDNLIGAQLFRDFRKESDKVWRGKVFVPDINKTFSGTITIINARTLKGEGCLVGRIGCKAQSWTRIR